MARHCSKCGRTGHYKSTCTGKKKRSYPLAKVSKTHIKRTGTVTRSRQGREWSGRTGAWLVMYHGGSTRKSSGHVVQHNKVWAVQVKVTPSGKCVIKTRHGKAGGEKNESTRKVQSCPAAMAEVDRLVRSKLAKGYRFADS